MFRFEKLDIWHDASAFASHIYTVTRTYPDGEKFGLVSQTRRAAVSIGANIAEGSGRDSDNDFARFITYSYSSLMEVLPHLAIAADQNYLRESDHQDLRASADQLARRLSHFRARLQHGSHTN